VNLRQVEEFALKVHKELPKTPAHVYIPLEKQKTKTNKQKTRKTLQVGLGVVQTFFFPK